MKGVDPLITVTALDLANLENVLLNFLLLSFDRTFRNEPSKNLKTDMSPVIKNNNRTFFDEKKCVKSN